MQNRKLWKIGLLILICAMLLVGLQRLKETGREAIAPGPIDAAEQQLAALYSMGQAVTPDPFQLTLKWQGEWSSLLAPEEAAGVLASRLGLPVPEAGTVQGRVVYEAKGQIEGFPAELELTTLEEGKHYAMLRMEAVGDEAAALERLQEAQRMAGESLADEGVQAEWNAAVQGVAWPAAAAVGKTASGKRKLDVTFDKLETKINQLPKLKLKQAEEFADELTASRTYSVDALPIAVQSGGHRVALQLAVHRNSGTGMDEITIGTPLLTVEY
ncbi:MAG: YwmB family TATA-box binding protein [Paenibacillaceae bacterium]|uniref:YwmB family TATA-box binding protein n=1 Tax=Paenibacillus mellifer TaxID=2937794 RepID=A0A9X1Y0F1_9BACL|nr:YwmB family TATA-box binding protein [Paenibacillus mellifer]MBW4841306.1 YwmB family TATA-box binding protein [Paenibacillaceae bacterium]MCK8489280.1 YwmB family TATA-box binding protein [Paenibacillus mellifer]